MSLFKAIKVYEDRLKGRSSKTSKPVNDLCIWYFIASIMYLMAFTFCKLQSENHSKANLDGKRWRLY